VANSTRTREHLRLYTEQLPKAPRQPLEDVASLSRVLETFKAATGWSLQYTPQALKTDRRCEAGSATRIGVNRLTHASCDLQVSLEPAVLDSDEPALGRQSPEAAVAREAAESLGGAIGGLLGELCETRNIVRKREAELAAGVPTVSRNDEEQHLAARLEASLKAAAEAVGCDAAALYMLDDATTELKMRSAWQLPFERMMAPPRPLQGAVADLEALLGHAVVLGDDTLMAMWKVPENFPAAVCVPVSSPTALLGTLWIFSRAKRDFNDRETNVIEIVAGRIAAELEREVLLRNKWQRPSAFSNMSNPWWRRCSKVGTWPAGPRKPAKWAEHSTIGSACPMVCWPWRRAERPTKALRAP
jgi:phosphoserine phosphatase RsbU/P